MSDGNEIIKITERQRSIERTVERGVVAAFSITKPRAWLRVATPLRCWNMNKECKERMNKDSNTAICCTIQRTVSFVAMGGRSTAVDFVIDFFCVATVALLRVAVDAIPVFVLVLLDSAASVGLSFFRARRARPFNSRGSRTAVARF
jgi:hypothetical protein